MTRKEAIRLTHQQDVLVSLGFTNSEADTLRRISRTLHRWSEHECNGAIQRDGVVGDGLPFWFNTNTGRKIGRVPDRERGAMRRLEAVVSGRNVRARIPGSSNTALGYYVQGGSALYILRPGDVPKGADVAGCYSRGIAVY
jgi:hypothetical protein